MAAEVSYPTASSREVLRVCSCLRASRRLAALFNKCMPQCPFMGVQHCADGRPSRPLRFAKLCFMVRASFVHEKLRSDQFRPRGSSMNHACMSVSRSTRTQPRRVVDSVTRACAPQRVGARR
eukprot:6036893-Pleurochrysis_carterae.AAC.1